MSRIAFPTGFWFWGRDFGVERPKLRFGRFQLRFHLVRKRGNDSRVKREWLRSSGREGGEAGMEERGGWVCGEWWRAGDARLEAWSQTHSDTERERERQ